MSRTETEQVETALGGVRGVAGEVRRFLGVPYAEPPVGDYRWRAPRPKQPWTGVLDATRFGPDPVQPAGAVLRGPGQSEDCLYLNIWCPRESAGPLPVLLWLPGGGFVMGAGSSEDCDGAALAERGVVVVTINYRVGVLGFLAHPALAAEADGRSGNYGLLDVLQALRWVRAHIGSFGGDPERITVFGVSAGSACISLLLTAPEAEGLFQGAILQSPGAGRKLATLDEAMAAGAALLPGHPQQLRALPSSELLAANGKFNAGLRSFTRARILRPILDSRLLQIQEQEALASGMFQALPMLVGNHLDEGRFFSKTFPVLDVDGYRDWVRQDFGPRANDVFDVYGMPREHEITGHMAQLFADTQFNFGARLLAHHNNARAPTWRYLFDAFDADGRPTTHTEDVPYVFGHRKTEPLTRDIMDAWVRFASTGELPAWPLAAADTAWRPVARRPEVGWRARELEFIASL